MSDTSKSTKTFLLGMLTGGIVAGAAVLFTTPKTGEQLRRNIKDFSHNVKTTISDLAKEGMEIKEKVQEVTQEGAAILKDFSEDVRRSVERWNEETEPNRERIQEELQKIEMTMTELEQTTGKH